MSAYLPPAFVDRFRHDPYHLNYSRVACYVPTVPQVPQVFQTRQLVIGQCGYSATVADVATMLADHAPSTQVLKIEPHKKGPKPTGAFFVTVVDGTEYELTSLNQRLRFVPTGVCSYNSAALESYDDFETRRILSFKLRRGEVLDHLPVYRVTVEHKGGPRAAIPQVDMTALGQRITKELQSMPKGPIIRAIPHSG